MWPSDLGKSKLHTSAHKALYGGIPDKFSGFISYHYLHHSLWSSHTIPVVIPHALGNLSVLTTFLFKLTYPSPHFSFDLIPARPLWYISGIFIITVKPSLSLYHHHRHHLQPLLGFFSGILGVRHSAIFGCEFPVLTYAWHRVVLKKSL